MFFSNFSFAQYKTEAEKNREKDRFEQKQKEKQDAYIINFLNELNVDDFQREIIKQKLYSYVDATKVILKEKTTTLRRKELIEQLDATHFNDIKEMVSEEVMLKIMDLIQNKNSKKTKPKIN